MEGLLKSVVDGTTEVMENIPNFRRREEEALVKARSSSQHPVMRCLG
jgi:hypothetical protein